MSGQRSFRGDAALRQQVVDRLSADGLPEYLASGPLAFGPDEKSPAGLMVQSSDVAQFPDSLGLPRWLAFALDEVAGGCPRQQALPRLASSIACWPVGVDIGPLAAQVAARVIEDAQRSVGRDDRELDEFHVLADQACKLLTGEGLLASPGTQDPWRILRRAAARACDVQASPNGRLLGRCVEAAAWSDLATADTTVAEVLRAWRILHFSLADRELGWTEALEQRLDELHSALEKEVASRSDGSAELFQELFKERHPEEAEALRRYYSSRHQLAETLAERGQSLLLDVLVAR